VLLWDRKAEHSKEENRNGYSVHRLHYVAPEGQIGLVPRLTRWWLWEFMTLWRLKPDAIHACDFDTALPAIAYATLASKKLVYDIFDFYAYMIAQPLGNTTRRWLARMERFVAKRADLVILADMARTVQLGKSFSGKVLEVLNVPPSSDVKEPEENEFTVFYGGMLSWERGLTQLVDATRRAGVRFVVAGHGADEGTLIPLFKNSPHVNYLGNITYTEVLRWTARSHVIAALYDPVIPNNRLAAPNKLFEAMMLSKPVIANEGTRPAEIVREIGCGEVVRYGDVEGLAESIGRMAAEPASRRNMGVNGRRAFELRFNWAVMENRLIEAYSNL